jgi:NADH-quinone oxidoreductase subunit N
VTATDLLTLLPLICLAYGAVVVLVVGAFWRSHAGVVALTLCSLAASLLTTGPALELAPRQVTPLLRVDVFALSYLALFVLGAAALTAFSWDYLAAVPLGRERFYSLLLLAVAGMGVLAASSHFASFFLGLETLSVSLYGLIGFTLRRPDSLEGSLKYLVLAGVSLSFLLLGMALVYFEFGTLEFAVLADRLRPGAAPPYMVLLGLGLILVGFGFKLALVPFHTWAPDVYQGAPAPVSALVATGSKAAMFALLLRFVSLLLHQQGPLFLLLELLAIVTMFGGNLLALFQGNLKRLLAYSSIAHMGYLVIPLLAGGEEGIASIGFYFVSYFITTIGAFGVISALSAGRDEMAELNSYQGLGYRRPWVGAALGLMMLSLAGIPLTVGFMAKLQIFAAAAHSGLWLLLVVGVVNSGLAAYYYLRVVSVLYSHADESEESWPRVRPASGLALAALSLLVVVLGLLPGPLIARAQHASRRWLREPMSARAAQATAAPSDVVALPREHTLQLSNGNGTPLTARLACLRIPDILRSGTFGRRLRAPGRRVCGWRNRTERASGPTTMVVGTDPASKPRLRGRGPGVRGWGSLPRKLQLRTCASGEWRTQTRLLVMTCARQHDLPLSGIQGIAS